MAAVCIFRAGAPCGQLKFLTMRDFESALYDRGCHGQVDSPPVGSFVPNILLTGLAYLFSCVSRRKHSELTETAIGLSPEEGVKELYAGTAIAFH